MICVSLAVVLAAYFNDHKIYKIAYPNINPYKITLHQQNGFGRMTNTLKLLCRILGC